MSTKRRDIKPIHVLGVGILGYGIYKALTAKHDSSLKGCAKPRNNLTLPLDVYGSLADQMQAAIWYYFDGFAEDDEAMRDILLQLNTDDDVKELICVYGVRGQHGYLSGHLFPQYNLVNSVQNYLDSDYKEYVNKTYAARGINYKFL